MKLVGEEEWSLPGDEVAIRSGGDGGRKRSLNTAIPSLTNAFVGATKDDKNSSSCMSAERLFIDESDFVSAVDNGVSIFVSFEGDVCSSPMLEVCMRSSLLFICLLLCACSSGPVASSVIVIIDKDFAIDDSVFAAATLASVTLSGGWAGT